MLKIFKLVVLFLPFSLSAAQMGTIEDSSMLDVMIVTFQANAQLWESTFVTVSKRIFFFLAVVEIAIELGTLGVKNQLELSTVLIVFARTMFIFGLFLGMLNAPTYFIQWFSSFNELAARANSSAGVTLFATGDLFGAASDILSYALNESSILDLGRSISLFLLAWISSILIMLIAIEYLLTTLKFYFLLYINILFLAFSAFSQTRQWAINGVVNLFKAGVEILMISLIVGSIMSSILQYSAKVIAGNNVSLVYLFMFVLSMYLLSRMVHPMVESFFVGSLARNDNVGGGRQLQASSTGATKAIQERISSMRSSNNTITESTKDGDKSNNSSSVSSNSNMNSTVSNSMSAKGSTSAGAKAASTSSSFPHEYKKSGK